MTVSGSGRTREKDTRAPARGPFCVWESSLAGEEGALLQGGLLPCGFLPFRMDVASPADMRQDGGDIPILFGASALPCNSPEPAFSALTGSVWRSTVMQLAHSHALLTDSPYPFFTYAAGVPAPL